MRCARTQLNRLSQQRATELTLHCFVRGGLPSGIHWPEIPTCQANAFVTVVLYPRGLSYINQNQVSPGEFRQNFNFSPSIDHLRSFSFASPPFVWAFAEPLFGP